MFPQGPGKNILFCEGAEYLESWSAEHSKPLAKTTTEHTGKTADEGENLTYGSTTDKKHQGRAHHSNCYLAQPVARYTTP